MIEGDATKYKILCNNIPQINCKKVLRFVDYGSNSLDNILQETNIPKNFDFLSIDIDGCDYYIIESLSVYHPKIVCIEFNPTVPNEVFFVQRKDFAIKQGASARAIVDLAKSKGYGLVALTETNLIFVQDGYLSDNLFDEVTLDNLRDDSKYRCYIFSGYDGSIIMSKALPIAWHSVELQVDDIQFLPKFLRKYRLDYNFIQELCFKIFLGLKVPRRILPYFSKLIHKK